VVHPTSGARGCRDVVTRPVGPDQGWVDGMLDVLRDIREHLRVGWAVFSRDLDLQKVIAYDLLITGEAASKVSKRTHRRNPTIPQSQLADLRNELLHEYGGLNLKDTWDFVQGELGGLERKLARVRIEGGGQSQS
jgi:uncharacterized protein with HEPN domain